jgi:outer membrane lipopolysaccharide assembly protein LptE/RlpB
MMKPDLKRALANALVLLLLVTLTASCGYSLAGRGSSLPSSVRVIGIPLFTNATPIYDLEQILTQRVRLEFLGRGKYQVVPDATGTDAVLTGEISSVAIQPTAFNAQQQASRYAITVVVKVQLKDLKNDKTLYENPGLTFRDEYEVTTGAAAGDAGTFLGQNKDALDRLSTDFARSVVSTILEAF